MLQLKNGRGAERKSLHPPFCVVVVVVVGGGGELKERPSQAQARLFCIHLPPSIWKPPSEK